MIPFKSVRVGPFDFQITRLEGGDAEENLGVFSELRMSISVRDSYASKQLEAETLLHEIFHAIYTVMNIQERDLEERTVSLMSMGTAGLIRDNPNLIKWLAKSLK